MDPALAEPYYDRGACEGCGKRDIFVLTAVREPEDEE